MINSIRGGDHDETSTETWQQRIERICGLERWYTKPAARIIPGDDEVIVLSVELADDCVLWQGADRRYYSVAQEQPPSWDEVEFFIDDSRLAEVDWEVIEGNPTPEGFRMTLFECAERFNREFVEDLRSRVVRTTNPTDKATPDDAGPHESMLIGLARDLAERSSKLCREVLQLDMRELELVRVRIPQLAQRLGARIRSVSDSDRGALFNELDKTVWLDKLYELYDSKNRCEYPSANLDSDIRDLELTGVALGFLRSVSDVEDILVLALEALGARHSYAIELADYSIGELRKSWLHLFQQQVPESVRGLFRTDWLRACFPALLRDSGPIKSFVDYRSSSSANHAGSDRSPSGCLVILFVALLWLVA